jgi:hypothetical protein
MANGTKLCPSRWVLNQAKKYLNPNSLKMGSLKTPSHYTVHFRQFFLPVMCGTKNIYFGDKKMFQDVLRQKAYIKSAYKIYKSHHIMAFSHFGITDYRSYVKKAELKIQMKKTYTSFTRFTQFKGRDQWEWIGLWEVAIDRHLVRIVVIDVLFYFNLAAILE